jgi:hypothetical protein
VSFKAREVLVVPVELQWFRLRCWCEEGCDDALLEPSDDEEGGRDVNKELDNLGLDDE